MKNQLAIRKALVTAGLRTFAYSFDGCGDSGSLNDLLLPSNLTIPLADIEDTLDESFYSATITEWIDNKYVTMPNPGFVAANTILDSVFGSSLVLEDMAYAALEHFDGDWVNNDGGYGVVGIDLLTGDFKIEGFQRYSDASPADSDGTCFDALDIDQPLDLTQHLKSTLNVS